MRRSIIVMAVVAVILTVGVVAGAVVLLRDGGAGGGADTAAMSEPATTQPTAGADDEDVPARPDCPSTGAGGIRLPCLGGETGPAEQEEDISVVNVWAWWCGPCRDELPHFDRFAAEHPEYEVVGVHADANPGNGAAFLNDLGVKMPSYQDSENLFAGTLGLPAVVPITVVFAGTEQIGVYPQPFESAEQIAAAVDEAVTDAGITAPAAAEPVGAEA